MNSQRSVFSSYNKYLYDSVANIEKQKGNMLGASISQAEQLQTYFKYEIVKQQNEIVTFDRTDLINSPYYQYSESKNVFDWKIIDSVKKISNISCQKAICIFGGRQWSAWFAKDIPISEGPYKFSGLPGLILEIYDNQNYWHFSFLKLINKKTILRDVMKKKAHQTAKNIFFKLLRESFDNAYELEQISGTITYLNGYDFFRKQAEKRARENNNWIELYKP